MTVSSWDDLAVDTISLLADCAPGLTLSAISTERSSCDEVSWRYWDGCNYRAAGWLERDGETLSPGLAARLAPSQAYRALHSRTNIPCTKTPQMLEWSEICFSSPGRHIW